MMECRTFLMGLLLLLGYDLILADQNHKAALKQRGTFTEELNQKAIHSLYNNGDFEPVIDVLERFQKNNPNCSFSDSVFLAKHLAVVYTASPETREKGRYYMMRLLEMVPSAKLVDMFVSDEIDRIFEKVREEFLARQHGFGLDSLTIQLPDRPRDVEPHHYLGDNSSASHKVGWNRPRNWVIGGLTAAAFGTAAYLYFANNEDDSQPREVIVPKPRGDQ